MLLKCDTPKNKAISLVPTTWLVAPQLKQIYTRRSGVRKLKTFKISLASSFYTRIEVSTSCKTLAECRNLARHTRERSLLEVTVCSNGWRFFTNFIYNLYCGTDVFFEEHTTCEPLMGEWKQHFLSLLCGSPSRLWTVRRTNLNCSYTRLLQETYKDNPEKWLHIVTANLHTLTWLQIRQSVRNKTRCLIRTWKKWNPSCFVLLTSQVSLLIHTSCLQIFCVW